MTDREKLIELIKEGDCNALTLADCSYCKYDGEDDCSYQLLADILIANGVTVQRWVPVTERLPEDDEEVVITWSKHLADMAFDVLSDFNQMEVTHWMPLPEAPKEEE